MKVRILLLLSICTILLGGCGNIGIQFQVVPSKNEVGSPEVTISPLAPTNTPTPTDTRPAVLTPTPEPTPSTLGGASAILFSSDRGGDYPNLYLQEFGTNTITRLTEGDSSTFAGPFSPSGGKIVYTGFGLTNSYIGVMNADGSDPVNLTQTDAYSDGFPAWSPDGSQIAFTSRRDGNNEIYLMDAYGYNLKRLTNNNVDDFAPTWSPDGKQIAFLSDRDNSTGVYSIYIMNAAASYVTRLTNDGGNDYSPAWSPNGSTIVFSSVQGGQYDLYSVSVDGSNLTNLTNTPNSDEWTPSWSPDGSMIAFATDRDANWEIYIMNANGSDPVNFTNNPADDEKPYWKPPAPQNSSQVNSGTLAFASFAEDALSIYTVNADGSSLQRLTDKSVAASHPAWSPDGAKIAFDACLGVEMLSDCPPGVSYDIYVMNADGSNLTKLVGDPSNDLAPAWSPDRRIAFYSNRSGSDQIYIINSDGSGLKQISRGGDRNSDPKWSANGEWLAYHCQNQGNLRICIQAADGSGEPVIIDGTEPVWSPLRADNLQLLAFHCFSNQHSDICTAKPDGSDLVNLTHSSTFDEISPAWSPDGRWIAYQSNQDNEISIYTVCTDCVSNPLEGRLTLGDVSANLPAWSPDGTLIAYLADGTLTVMHTDGSGQTKLARDVLGAAVWKP